jgi:hypothetical protein
MIAERSIYTCPRGPYVERRARQNWRIFFVEVEARVATFRQPALRGNAQQPAQMPRQQAEP